WDGKKQVEAFGTDLWATPTWRRYVLPFRSLRRVWARAGDKKLTPAAVRTIQLQRLIWSGGLSSTSVVLDQVEFVRGVERPFSEGKERAVALRIDAGKRVTRVRRFWRAISVADTVEQNSDFAGPEGEAMRTIGRDRTFDYARIAWHACRNGSAWVPYRYGKPFYTEDADGRSVYQFADQDKLVEHIRKCNLRPMFLLHTLPREIASEPPPGERKASCCPPRDYKVWQRVVRRFVQHYADKYGVDEVSQWYWEIWNEPDLWWSNWKSQGKHAGYDAYFRLFDHAAAGIREVLPKARIGGPAVAGWPRDYPAKLLQHAVDGTNDVTGEKGSPLGFLSYHGYAGTFDQMLKLYEAKAALDRHGKGRPIEIVSTEYGNAIWGADVAGRYQAAALCQMLDACVHAARHDDARLGGLYWFGTMRSFSPRNDAWFAPASATARYQITTLFLCAKGTVLAKPVYNVYRALNFLDEDCLAVAGASLGDPVRALATVADDRSRVSVLVYRHDWLARTSTGDSVTVNVAVENAPFAGPVRVREFRIDEAHSDVFAAWRAAGSPIFDTATPEQIRAIKAHDALEEAAPPRVVTFKQGDTWQTRCELGPHSVALFVLTAGE
ncbi:hypothetical protein HQ576_05995, partial [bacterium]|nr:hypothetical protein [bacterium]